MRLSLTLPARRLSDLDGAGLCCSGRELHLRKNVPIGGTAHQAGTLRFETDPRRSVLDGDCQTHDLDNPYATDASFLPSAGAVNPTLTIIADALWMADGIADWKR